MKNLIFLKRNVKNILIALLFFSINNYIFSQKPFSPDNNNIVISNLRSTFKDGKIEVTFELKDNNTSIIGGASKSNKNYFSFYEIISEKYDTIYNYEFYDFSETTKSIEGKNAIVVLLDESGSMRE